MRIEKYLPSFDVRDYVEARVRSDPARAYAAFRSVDLEQSRLVRLLFSVRALPARLLGRPVPPKTAGTFLEQVLALGWRVLEEEPDRELVVGAVTQPWAAEVRFRGLARDEFVGFSEPGFTKIVWNLAVRPAEAGFSLLSTETRVAATDPVSRRRFRLYWVVVRVGVRLIRIATLRLLRRNLERNLAADRDPREPLGSSRA